MTASENLLSSGKGKPAGSSHTLGVGARGGARPIRTGAALGVGQTGFPEGHRSTVARPLSAPLTPWRHRHAGNAGRATPSSTRGTSSIAVPFGRSL